MTFKTAQYVSTILTGHISIEEQRRIERKEGGKGRKEGGKKGRKEGREE